jgi:ubiquinone biosynthesis protein UbiJ
MLDRPFLAGLNHLLGREPWARQRLRPFAGRGARISLPPLFSLDLTVAEDGTLHGGPLASPDVRISLPEHAPLRFFGHPQEALAAARLEGTADFAEALGFVFRNLRWDAEEDLARLLGDIPARRLAGLGTSLFNWQKEAWGRLSANFSEYFRHELGASGVIQHREWQGHQQAVTAAAAETDALAARLERLQG